MTDSKKISIIGLGQMGKKIAEMYVESGYTVTVWNRTMSKSRELRNVKIAESAEEAVFESKLIIICVHDNDVVLKILSSVSNQEVFKNRIILNLTTGSPKEANRLEAMINGNGGHYLNGAIQVAPDQMGLPETTILMAGDADIFEEIKSDLQILGGNLRHLSNHAAASPAMDLATLTWLYGSYIGLMYGARLSQAFGLKLGDYSEIIGEIVPGFTSFFKHEVAMIDQGNYKVTQSPLSISVSATKRIADTFNELPVAQAFPEIISSILKQADEKYGQSEKEVAVIFKVLEANSST